MGNGKRLTDFQIKNLKAEDKRYTAWGERGLGVRVTPNGIKTFIFKYRFDGKVRWMTLGTYPKMKLAGSYKAHADAWDLLNRGIDPGAKALAKREEERKAPTVAGLVSEYLERHAKQVKRSWETDKRVLEKDALPMWGNRKAKNINKRDVITLLDSIMERGAPIMARRTFAIIRKMFNFGVERDIIAVSPCIGIKPPGQEKRRDRVLSSDEVRTFWLGLDKLDRVSQGIKLALKLELVTAQRKGECCMAAWEDIDLEDGWWTIPGEQTELRRHHNVKEGLAKNKLPHRVPLTPLAIEILQAAKALSGDSPWVFPSPRTPRPITPPAINHAMRLHKQSLGLDFWPHDLRRTTASLMTGIGIPRLVVKKILNHAETDITATYDRHSYDREKQEALERWARKLGEIIHGGEPGKVIPITRANS
jgi:integrase